jgi:hypothetical protein
MNGWEIFAVVCLSILTGMGLGAPFFSMRLYERAQAREDAAALGVQDKYIPFFCTTPMALGAWLDNPKPWEKPFEPESAMAERVILKPRYEGFTTLLRDMNEQQLAAFLDNSIAVLQEARRLLEVSQEPRI